MTAARRQRKVRRNLLKLALAGFAAPWALPLRLGAATTERVVADRYSGLAIDGFDPVSYFIDGEPKQGVSTHEYRFAGVIWRFRNSGNQAAFMETPDAYMPRFGGYDPVGVARGVPAPGNPLVWLMARERLYLFYNQQAREQFLANPSQVLATAVTKWPAVEGLLVP